MKRFWGIVLVFCLCGYFESRLAFAQASDGDANSAPSSADPKASEAPNAADASPPTAPSEKPAFESTPSVFDSSTAPVVEAPPANPPLPDENVNPYSQIKKLKTSKQSKTKSAKNRSGQFGVIQADGAPVYLAADFDSKVIAELQAGTRVRSSKKVYKGKGIGSFYKVKLANGKLGFVADSDIIPEFKKINRPGHGKKTVVNPDYRRVENQREGRESLYLTRYLGATVGRLNFSEKFSGQTYSSTNYMLGFKATGPGLLFDGPPTDFTFSFHWGAPSHYTDLTGKEATGFFVFSEVVPIFPISEWGNNLAYFGIGLMGTYTRFTVNARSSTIDSQELRVGLEALLGYAYRFRKYAFKGELRYYFEKTQYLGLWAGWQFEY